MGFPVFMDEHNITEYFKLLKGEDVKVGDIYITATGFGDVIPFLVTRVSANGFAYETWYKDGSFLSFGTRSFKKPCGVIVKKNEDCIELLVEKNFIELLTAIKLKSQNL